jgi:hypothetical protein
MKELIEYVMKYAVRGACQCGKCIDAPENPEQHQPGGHTADLIFFKVSVKDGASSEELAKLVRANVKGSFGDVDLFDGEEHNYMELGGWIGDQGLAMMLMGLGTTLGMWTLMTPRTMLPAGTPDDLVQMMAGQGMIAVKVEQ